MTFFTPLFPKNGEFDYMNLKAGMLLKPMTMFRVKNAFNSCILSSGGQTRFCTTSGKPLKVFSEYLLVFLRMALKISLLRNKLKKSRGLAAVTSNP